MDCLFDLSLLNTKLALLMNLANPLGLSSGPPEPSWADELILVENCCWEVRSCGDEMLN